jgi:hypothetical protein
MIVARNWREVHAEVVTKSVAKKRVRQRYAKAAGLLSPQAQGARKRSVPRPVKSD